MSWTLYMNSRGSLWWRRPAVQSVKKKKNTQVYSAEPEPGAGVCGLIVFGSREEKLLVLDVGSRFFAPSLVPFTSCVTRSWPLRRSWRWRSPAAPGRVRQTDGTCFQSHSGISWQQIQRSWKKRGRRHTGIFIQEQGDFRAQLHLRKQVFVAEN